MPELLVYFIFTMAERRLTKTERAALEAAMRETAIQEANRDLAKFVREQEEKWRREIKPKPKPTPEPQMVRERPMTDVERLAEAMSLSSGMRSKPRAQERFEAEKKRIADEEAAEKEALAQQISKEFAIDVIPPLRLVKAPERTLTIQEACRYDINHSARSSQLEAMLLWLNHPLNINSPTAETWKKAKFCIFAGTFRVDPTPDQGHHTLVDVILWVQSERRFKSITIQPAHRMAGGGHDAYLFATY